MRELIENLFANDQHLDLYLGVIESIESFLKTFEEDSWRQAVNGDEALLKQIHSGIVDSGLMSLGVSEQDGGMGGGLLGPVLMSDMLAQAGIMSFNAIITHFSRHPLVKLGTPAQIEKYVAPTLTGEKLFCILATEPNAGTNTFSIGTKAKKSGDRWLLNGQKIWITDADKADYGLLIAKTEIDNPRALSIFVIDMKSPGIEMQPLNVQAFPNEKQFTVFFDNVELPADALIGEEGKGAVYMFEGLNPERFMTSAAGLGISNLALKVTKEYIEQRAPFGKPIGSYQGIQHRLAEYKAHTDAARLMLYYGVKRYDQNQTAGVQANMAKYLSSVAGTHMADAAIQFHGGSGMDEDTGLLALWRIVRTLQIAPINNEMVLNYIAEHDIGLPKSY